MMEHDRALDVEVLVERDARMLVADQLLERIFAVLDRSPAQVFPVDLDEVEGTERGAGPVTIATDQAEDGQTGPVADDGFAVDDAGVHGQARDRLHDERKPVSKVFAVATDQADLVAVTSGDDPETVVLDLVNPVGAPRRRLGETGQAGLEGSDRQTPPKQTHNAKDNPRKVAVESVRAAGIRLRG